MKQSLAYLILFYSSLHSICHGQITFNQEVISETLDLGQTEKTVRFYFKNNSNKTVAISKLLAAIGSL